MRRSTLSRMAGIAALAGAIAVTGCGGGNGGDSPAAAAGTSTGGRHGRAPTGTLVVDNSFVDKGLDPGHEFTPTNNMLVQAMYDTLVTFEPGKTDPKPSPRRVVEGLRRRQRPTRSRCATA